MQLGRIGIWSGQFWGERTEVVEAAAELEELGFGTLWFPNRPSAFELARGLLDATRRVVVASGIVSIWTHTARDAAAAHHAITEAHPDRFLLGLGVSHPHLVDREEPGRYSRPVAKMREYLDELDAAPTPVPTSERVLAALGPRMLALARDRSAGAHPYLVTADHTRRAREALGPERLLAVEQAVALESDPARARGIAREHLSRYLTAPNYANNWFRLGFTPDDVADGGSDRLVDALVAWGSLDVILDRIAQHHQAGADHVCIQVVTATPQGMPREEWRTLAAVLAD
jgi:probable F420-dependent oxidoreductase